MPDATLLPIVPRDDLWLFFESFLMRWEGSNTQASYRQDLMIFTQWCEQYGLHPIADIKRTHLELYMRYLKDDRKNAPSTISHRIGTLSQMYELAIDDELIAKNPARLVRRPKAHVDQGRRVALTREETQRLVRAAYDSSPTDHALIVLMAYLGLRVSEACELDIADCLHVAKAHRCLRFVGKGDKLALIPQPPAVMRAIDAAIAGRTEGPLLLRRDGSRMTRRSADRVVKRCAKAVGITGNISPHVLRHGFIVGSIDAGVPIRQVQLSARHSDITTTIKIYDRGRANLDTHSAHALAAWLGSVA
ncbi:tyrosine-type recombinase/integrase [Williamsia sp.]|uniref:tyrosine-type recombinase/integrase n=1 Tax=Williamsia sp. TaxID=1872085 RepID=UPI002F9327B9